MIPHPKHICTVVCLPCHKSIQVISHVHTLSHAQNTSHAELFPGRSFPVHMPWQRSDGKAESYILGCKHLDNSTIRMAHPKPVITHLPVTHECPDLLRNCKAIPAICWHSRRQQYPFGGSSQQETWRCRPQHEELLLCQILLSWAHL